jgi:hypothetical protein
LDKVNFRANYNSASDITAFLDTLDMSQYNKLSGEKTNDKQVQKKQKIILKKKQKDENRIMK